MSLGVVLSGGGSRAAYQVGALKALYENSLISESGIRVITGTSIGAVNSLILGAGLKHPLSQSLELLEELWKKRTYKNTFSGHVSRTFLKAVQVAMLRYRSPGPVPSAVSIFDPSPLRDELDTAINELGGIKVENFPSNLISVGIMTTVEGVERKPLLLAVSKRESDKINSDGATFELLNIKELSAAHGFASAALPSVLPAVDLNLDKKEVRLVDGGICDNIPVDPALRLGADSILLIDSSGRKWWFDQYGEPYYTKPSWEIPSPEKTFCKLPVDMYEIANKCPLGKLLKDAVGQSTKSFIQALGPTWPIFRILKHKMGEDLAYEVLSYAALHPDYTQAVMEQGYKETIEIIKTKKSFLKAEC